MDSAVNNSVINYQAAHPGVLTAPDSVGKVPLYSAADTEKLYREMTKDIYQKTSRVNSGKSYSTPKPVIFLGGIVSLAFLWSVCKKLFKK